MSWSDIMDNQDTLTSDDMLAESMSNLTIRDDTPEPVTLSEPQLNAEDPCQHATTESIPEILNEPIAPLRERVERPTELAIPATLDSLSQSHVPNTPMIPDEKTLTYPQQALNIPIQHYDTNMVQQQALNVPIHRFDTIPPPQVSNVPIHRFDTIPPPQALNVPIHRFDTIPPPQVSSVPIHRYEMNMVPSQEGFMQSNIHYKDVFPYPPPDAAISNIKFNPTEKPNMQFKPTGGEDPNNLMTKWSSNNQHVSRQPYFPFLPDEPIRQSSQPPTNVKSQVLTLEDYEPIKIDPIVGVISISANAEVFHFRTALHHFSGSCLDPYWVPRFVSTILNMGVNQLIIVGHYLFNKLRYRMPNKVGLLMDPVDQLEFVCTDCGEFDCPFTITRLAYRRYERRQPYKLVHESIRFWNHKE